MSTITEYASTKSQAYNGATVYASAVTYWRSATNYQVGQLLFYQNSYLDFNNKTINEIRFTLRNNRVRQTPGTIYLYGINRDKYIDTGTFSTSSFVSQVIHPEDAAGDYLGSISVARDNQNHEYIVDSNTNQTLFSNLIAYFRGANPRTAHNIILKDDSEDPSNENDITYAVMQIDYATASASVPTVEDLNGNTISSAAKGSEVVIKTNRASSAYTHTIYFIYNNTSHTIGTQKGVVESVNWTVPSDIGDYVTIYCDTFSGNTKIGSTQSTQLVLKNPSGGGAPTINSVTLRDNDQDIYRQFNDYVRGKSQLVVSVNASPATGTQITGYRVTVDGQTYSSTSGQNITTGVLMSPGTRTVTISVTGSGGEVTTATRSITVLDYTGPTLTSFGVTRCGDDGNPDAAGAQIKLTAAGEASSMSGHNTVSAVIKHRVSGSGDDWDDITGMSLTVTGSDLLLYDVQIDLDLDEDEADYDFRVEFSDFFVTVFQQTGTGQAYPLLEFVQNRYAQFHVPVRTPAGQPLAVQYGGTGETSLEPLIQEILSRIPTPSIDAGSSYVVLGSVCIIWGTAMIYSFSTNGSATVLFSDALPAGKSFAAAPIVHATPKWTTASTYGSIVSTYVQSVTAAQAVVCMEASRPMSIQGSEYFNWLAIGTLNT